MAAAKIVGLEVTPTTECSSTSDCRFPLRMRSRDRSSSQTATPAEERSASLSFCAMSLCLPWGWGAVLLQGPPHTREWWGAAGSLPVAGGVRQTARGGHRAGRDGGPGRGRLHALACGGHDRLVGEPELLVEHGVRGAGPVV